MNHVFTKPKKSMTLSTIKEFEAWISRQYNQLIQIIRVDGERSLGKDFDDWTAGKSITVEWSAPYTPAQNGAAERSGGVILTKARAIRIGVQLPEDLWPEAV